MKQFKTINYKGATLVISSEGEIYREAHTTVDRLGKVHKYPRRKLSPCKEPSTGYMRIGLRISGTLYNLSIHRLVARAFLGDPEPGQVVNHINEDRTDNRLENLEWVSQKENIAHSTRLHPEYAYNSAKKVAQIKDGKIIRIYRSAREAAKEMGVTPSAVGIATRASYRTCRGYKWKFV